MPGLCSFHILPPFKNQDIEETDSIGCPRPNDNDNTIVIAASAVSAFVFLVGIGMFVHVKTKKDLNRSFPTIWQKSLVDALLDEWSGVSPDAHTEIESGMHVSNLTAGDFAPDAVTRAPVVRNQNVTGFRSTTLLYSSLSTNHI
jgi:hypothetical protein